MKKILFLGLILCLSYLFSAFYKNPKAEQTQPNIIFILVDDMGYTDLGCCGNPYNETPNIDSLAHSGMRFTQAYAASPVCSPSRAAILTGKHPARLKLTNYLGFTPAQRTDSLSPVLPAEMQQSLPLSEITLAERLKPLGYRTGMIGKWHLGFGKEPKPWEQGFDYTRMIDKNALDYYNYTIVNEENKTVFADKGKDYLTDKLSDYALDFIEKKKTDEPFFLYLAYSAPHVLLVPRGDKLGKYFWKYEKFNGKFNPNYAAMIESIDDGVGRIMKTLSEKGLLENTIVVFTSDNGAVGLPELGPKPTDIEGLRKWKGHVYKGGNRIPAIVFWKGKIQPFTNTQYFINTDYTPTFLDILGEKAVLTEDGMSLKQTLFSPEKPFERGALYWHYPHFSNQMGRPKGAVRQGDWKLIESYEDNSLELYNLKEDLGETKNLAQQNKTKTNELHQLFTHWLTDMQANMSIRKEGK